MNASAPLPGSDLLENFGFRFGSQPIRPKALFIFDAHSWDLVYPPRIQRELAQLADFYTTRQTRETIEENPEVLADVEVIFSSWGAPRMDACFLEAAPNLQAVFYGAGSITYLVTPEFWEREIVVTSAAMANAAPVAEYTLSVALLALRNFWRLSREVRHGGGWGDHTRHVPGAYRSKIGLIGCGMVARRVLELTKPLDLEFLVYDPYLSREEAARLGVHLCSLDEAFRSAEVVSLHVPSKPETTGMITGEHFGIMKYGATFINTSRPSLIRENEMLSVLKERPDLQVFLDVTEPEPLPKSSPLLEVPGLTVTPHIAGSLGPECARLGEFMVAEFRRYLAGERLHGEITRERAAFLA